MELATAVDEIAERIRALGLKAPASYSAFQRLATVKEASGDETADEMIRELVLGQEKVTRTARNRFLAAIQHAASDVRDALHGAGNSRRRNC